MKTELKQKVDALFSQWNKIADQDTTGFCISKALGSEMFYILDPEFDQILKKNLTYLGLLKYFDEQIEHINKLIGIGGGHLKDTPDAQLMRGFLASFAKLKKEHPFDSDEWNF